MPKRLFSQIVSNDVKLLEACDGIPCDFLVLMTIDVLVGNLEFETG